MVDDSFKEEPLFYLYDGRGNTTELTDNRGVARDRYRYDPYGVPLPKATIGPNPWYTENPYRYNGEDYDITTGLQYLRARYYEPSTGRFLSRDSYLGNVMEPLTLNRYAYVSNNPIMYDDPTGHIFDKAKDWFKAAQDFVDKAIDDVTNFVTEVITNVSNAVDNFVDTMSGFISGNSSNGNSNYNTSGEKYISDSKRDSKSSNNKNNNKNSNIYKPKNFIEERFSQIQVNTKKDCTGLEKVSKQDAKVYVGGVSESTAVIRAMTPTEKLKDGLSDLIPFVPGLNLINDVKVATTGIDVTGRAYFNDEMQDAKVAVLLDVGLSVIGMSAASIDEAAKVADDAIEELSEAGQKILKNLDEVAGNLNEYGIDPSKLKFTDTAQNHLNEVYKNDKIIKIGEDGFKTKFYAGESTRPYVENGTTLLVDEIMKAKSPIPDPGGIPNGLRWDVPGSFAGKEGVWELVINKDTNTIVHFLFNSK
jgi:RHS repeat-associated protein